MNMSKRINDITPEEWDSLKWSKSKATEIQVGGDHYAKQKEYQPAEVIQKLKLSWCKSNAIKYILRAGNKGPSTEDLKKAIHYLELELEIEAENT